MVLPFILGAAAISAGVTGIVNGLGAVADNSDAEELQQEAQAIYQSTERDLQYVRRTTTESLEKLGKLKLEMWDQQLGRFVQLFEQLKNVEVTGQVNVEGLNTAKFTQEELGQMKNLSLKAQEVMVGGVGALGSGALVGVASYGGAVMFASASTGTAISSLAGAAATNATLAWFGGGSLAAGGFGMAGGMAVLGGIVAGPMLAVGGLMMAAKARENLANAKKYQAQANEQIEQMKNAMAVLDAIKDVASEFEKVILRLENTMTPVLDSLESIIIASGTDYSAYNKSQKRQVYLAVQFAQSLKLLLETPLLTQDGAVDQKCFKALQQGKNILSPQS